MVRSEQKGEEGKGKDGMGKEGNANDNERQGKAKIEMKRKEEKTSSGRDKIKN